MSETIEIPLNRKKLSLIFIVLLIFILGGAAGTVLAFNLKNEVLIEILGTISLIIFSLGIGLVFVYFAESRKKGPGLIINAQGITENASVDNVGFIPWTDITGFKEAHELNQKVIGVLVNNPNEYISRKSLFLRGAVQNRYKINGFVFSIPSNRLQISYDELKTLLEQKLKEHR
jgi:hypothetical protein